MKVGDLVMTATSNPFTENRVGVIADTWVRGDVTLFILDDRGLRLVMHPSELVLHVCGWDCNGTCR